MQQLQRTLDDLNAQKEDLERRTPEELVKHFEDDTSKLKEEHAAALKSLSER